MAPTPQEHAIRQRDAGARSAGERVVISGMAGLYPQANNVKELSDILYNKVNPITKEALRYKFTHPEAPQYSGSVPQLERFDAQFFKVHYRLGISMDPMSRKMLEIAYQAIYDAGINPLQLSGRKVGVYIGSCYSETEKTVFYDVTSVTGIGIVGCSKSMFANRISYWLNAKGPSIAIDDACCSSTAALEQACQAINRGECEAAIVGGSYLSLHPQSSVHYGRIMKLSKDGKIKSFDENADGCVKSEAINILFLQKAKDALRIYAEVIHVKTEYIGMPQSSTGPIYGLYRNPTAITNYLKKFYEEADVPPQAVEYVEAMGSAIPKVDKSELEAIDEVFCNQRARPLFVGSVTSNIGYAEAASGLSAITKVLLGYHTGELAANLHCSQPRRDVAALREGRMRVLTDHQRFGRTYAAVNGMSVTGVNSHVLLQGHYKPRDLTRYKSSIPYLIPISARVESSVKNILDNLKSRPINPEELALLHNIHQQNVRGHLGRGFTILQTNENKETVSLCEKADYFDVARRPLWFVYSGMGSQWAGMGAQLMRIPVFAAAIERCCQVLEPKGIDIVHIITSPDKKIFDNILHSFVGIAAVQIGLTDILTELGLKPDGIIGHSVGELGCAYADGCLSAEEMILAAYSRGLVSLQTPFIRGSMAAVGLGYQQISKMCPPEIEVACHNGPESSTISGPAEAMTKFVAELTAKGIFAKEVPCSNIAYHSRYIVDAGPSLLNYLSEVIKTPRARSERWISTSIPQDSWTEPLAKFSSAEYHTNNLLNPVLFEETSRLIPSDAVLVEVAPHGLLQAILKRSLPPSCTNIALTRRAHPDNVVLVLEAVGKLYVEGYNPKVQALYPKVEFPVSTGTPHLSHLVEWVHDETWAISLYNSIDMKIAASTMHIISLHDQEHAYLRGNVIKGQILFPFSAALVAVWDTLAMSLGDAKKQMSVEFHDVHLHAQPPLHDQRSVRLSVTLHRGNGAFEINNGSFAVASGTINMIKNFKDGKNTLKLEQPGDDTELSADDFYNLLEERDYSCSGEFRSIASASASLEVARVRWRGDWAMLLDGMLQLHALRQAHDAVSAPAHIAAISIDVKEHANIINNALHTSNEVLLKAEVLEKYDLTRCGGITIEHIKHHNLPPVNVNKMALSTRSFIPNIQFNTDDTWGGEYYVPVEELSTKDDSVTLQCEEIGNLDSLCWVEAPEPAGDGIIVSVHYAGLNNKDVKKASGASLLRHDIDNKYGMDFSGTTESGERVMGIVPSGSCSSRVRAVPEMLWPVPAHWSLEDAATVPLAYAQVFYCFGIKAQLRPGMSVLIHGGAGALGQAAISVALALGCEVFTTVSDTRKKHFLNKLYPELKNDHIGNSRDGSFGDMVFNATKGKGCNFVINTGSGDFKNNAVLAQGADILKDDINPENLRILLSQLMKELELIEFLKKVAAILIKCCCTYGIMFDTTQLQNHEKYVFGMHYLNKERSYYIVDFSCIFSYENYEDLKALQVMMSEGIACGYVRPLTRVSFAAGEAARALRLLAGSKHRGRALLRLRDEIHDVQPSLACHPEQCQLVLCDDKSFGLQMADRLVSRGATKLYVHSKTHSMAYLEVKKCSWQRQGVQVEFSTEDLESEESVRNLLKNALNLGAVEGVYVIVDDGNDTEETLLTYLHLALKQLCSNIKYFVVANMGNIKGQYTCLSRVQNQLPATMITVLQHKDVDGVGESVSERSAWRRSAAEATERALRCGPGVHRAAPARALTSTLLHRIARLADLTITEEMSVGATLKELGVEEHNLNIISMYLRNQHNIALSEKEIQSLSIKEIREMDYSEFKKDNIKGFASFYSYVDSDELLASTEMVFLSTLTHFVTMRDEELDTSQQYLCIVPGMEGHHARFRTLCERLKLPALALQPGLDDPHEAPRDLAHRYAQILLTKLEIKDNFYLLGYESGVQVALEVASILEDRGLTGTVFCIGHMPDEFQVEVERQLCEYKSEEQLQDAVVRHMFQLMVREDAARLESELQAAATWPQKVDATVRSLLGRVPHSAQYARALIEAALARITQARRYESPVRGLRSRVVLLRAATSQPLPAGALQQYSRQPVVLHQLQSGLAHAAADLCCAAVVNQHLHPDILEQFEKRNTCDTYLMNADCYMTMQR